MFHKHWLFLLLLNVLQFALSIDAKGGGKGSGSKSSSKGSKSSPNTIVHSSNGQCYNEQNVLIKCPNNYIKLIVYGIGVGIFLLGALCVWLYKRYWPKKSAKSLDTESKGVNDGSEVSHSKVPLVEGETHENDSKADDGYKSDDESTYYEHSEEKVSKY